MTRSAPALDSCPFDLVLQKEDDFLHLFQTVVTEGIEGGDEGVSACKIASCSSYAFNPDIRLLLGTSGG